jgi:hypothetical protein
MFVTGTTGTHRNPVMKNPIIHSVERECVSITIRDQQFISGNLRPLAHYNSSICWPVEYIPPYLDCLCVGRHWCQKGFQQGSRRWVRTHMGRNYLCPLLEEYSEDSKFSPNRHLNSSNPDVPGQLAPRATPARSLPPLMALPCCKYPPLARWRGPDGHRNSNLRV